VTVAEDAWPGKDVHYRMHPANVPCLTAAGIDCCALANNHLLDWGPGGLLETVEALHKAGIRTAGAGSTDAEAAAPAIVELAGLGRVLVFAFATESSGVERDWAAGRDRSGVNRLDDLSGRSVDTVAWQVQDVKRPGDVVVASIHWGSNWGFSIPGEQRAFARRLIDHASVDVVHGHSSHHVKGIEIHRDRPILYGRGDFLTDYEGIGGYEEFRDDLGLMYFPGRSERPAGAVHHDVHPDPALPCESCARSGRRVASGHLESGGAAVRNPSRRTAGWHVSSGVGVIVGGQSAGRPSRRVSHAPQAATIVPANLGFPRLGERRELKAALEQYWAGEIGDQDLLATGQRIRRENWALQAELGLGHIPSNDFSFYDHVLDMALVVGAVPPRFRHAPPGPADLGLSFAMARGVKLQGASPAKAARDLDLSPLPLTKWFDTNYHYVVPEFDARQEFQLESTKPLDEFLEAMALGVRTRPVLLGPVSFLLLGRFRDGHADPITLIDRLLPAYEALLGKLAEAGADWVQFDEPCLVWGPPPSALRALELAYVRLARAAPRLRRLLAVYFASVGASLSLASRLPIDALHLDLATAPEQLEPALATAPASLSLSLGLVDGRNVWRTDLDRALVAVDRACERLGPDRVQVAPSCSLLHVPLDLDLESEFDRELRPWLAFSKQKLREVTLLTSAIRHGRETVAPALAETRAALAARHASARTHDEAVRRRVSAVTAEMTRRVSPYPVRRMRQRGVLRLPRFPTTTVGSLPQTREVRATRAAFRRGRLTQHAYDRFLSAEIERAIRTQEEIGLDVLVHGEFERADMVEYFAEQLNGFAVTQHGWVQSYGSRCVRPPILFGDVSRRGPMTVRWSRYAQSLTDRPVKGMLTGPVTMAQWAFVRDDEPLPLVCRQIALALRDEVTDLESAGIRAIQIDEPAFRQGLPPGPDARRIYLAWAVEAFRLASSGVDGATQLHVHMCYSHFNDVLDAITELDADVLAIEAARSGMRVLDAFRAHGYPRQVGPGVYDIHSPRVPTPDEILERLRQALGLLSADQLWVNPDCGLKTRQWDEVRPALEALVVAARRLRDAHGAPLAGRGQDEAGASTGLTMPLSPDPRGDQC
jgi:5-methyltetrahydropteroyltriglutamate--homocysteine methyltransferase